MAIKPFHFLSIIFLALIYQLALAKTDLPSKQKPSAFDFIKKLQGCHKGNITTGLHNLKHYLQRFGYLDPNQIHANDDVFDSGLESAVKNYQKNYHLKPTGSLDRSTVAKMIIPRCGVPDIINGVNTMQNKSHHHPSSNSFHTVSHYTFFPGNPRWPPSKTHLTYRFAPNTNQGMIAPVTRAFQKWASATHFSFQQVASNGRSDIFISFFYGAHGDGWPFDGPGGILAHAFAPTDGRFHFDAAENWVNGAVPNAFDLETVALHEIGHLLGLDHSQYQAAIMFATIEFGRTKGLHADDIQGIRALYP